ncbi:Chitinase [Bertholletia excelsa]
MGFSKLFTTILVIEALFLLRPPSAAARNSNLFGEYIGAEFKGVKFSDVPINPGVQFHFILAFAIDYTTSSSPTPTNGKFNVFWDSANLGPSQVSAIKSTRSNVKVALSLGGATVKNINVLFKPSSVDSWVSNAVSSLTQIIKQYHLDGIDIDYESFASDPDTFAQCIGRLITTLKNNKVISFASIAPFDDPNVQKHYLALMKSYGKVIDYVNFQFYAYSADTTVAQFVKYYETQSSNYGNGKVLAGFASDGKRGLSPQKGFFQACQMLKNRGELAGIFAYSADDSKANGFQYEKQAQALLT